VQDPFSTHNSTEDSLIDVTCQSLSFKVLGGSSCTNVCLHHRGSAEDYNEWNVPGWTATEVLPVFKAVQKDMTDRSPEFHGKDGEWVMDEVRYQNPLSKRFLEVGAAAGLGTNDDFNNWSRPQDGVGRFQVSEVNGERCSGAQAFLHKALKRKNLKVRTGTMVRKIDFDESKTALGVSYDLMGDDTCTVSCLSKEVCWAFFFLFRPSYFFPFCKFRGSKRASTPVAKLLLQGVLLLRLRSLCAAELAQQSIFRSMASLLFTTIRMSEKICRITQLQSFLSKRQRRE
jgi:hypothetical protein